MLKAVCFNFMSYKEQSFGMNNSTIRSRETLTLSILGKTFSRRHFQNKSYFSKKMRFDVSCKLSPKETVCMKCQTLFSRKNIGKLLSNGRVLNLPRE